MPLLVYIGEESDIRRSRCAMKERPVNAENRGFGPEEIKEVALQHQIQNVTKPRRGGGWGDVGNWDAWAPQGAGDDWNESSASGGMSNWQLVEPSWNAASHGYGGGSLAGISDGSRYHWRHAWVTRVYQGGSITVEEQWYKTVEKLYIHMGTRVLTMS